MAEAGKLKEEILELEAECKSLEKQLSLKRRELKKMKQSLKKKSTPEGFKRRKKALHIPGYETPLTTIQGPKLSIAKMEFRKKRLFSQSVSFL